MTIYRHAFVLPSCLEVFERECKLAPWRETGGALVGYVSNDNAIVVVGASGPGPRAQLNRYSVTLDGQHAGNFCDDAYRRSKGRLDYVGDWHRHCGFSLEPSGSDIEAMKLMANYKGASIRHPISVIFRRWPMAFKVFVFTARGTLDELSHSIWDTKADSFGY